MLKRKSLPGRTPLFRALQRAFQKARKIRSEAADRTFSFLSEPVGRREFLRGAGALSLYAASSSLLTACSSSGGDDGGLSPRVVIIGAGMAGLNAALKLQQAGVRARIYEASNRPGGRMFTARNLMGRGLTTELGGEFIDSGHEEMLALVDEFGLELLDTESEIESQFAEAYFFNGQHYTEEQVIAEFVELVPRIDEDFNSTGEVVDFQNEGGGTALDRTSIAEYLDQIGARGFIRTLLDVAYLTEYGLETDQQSSLNLIFLIGTDVSEGFEIFGESDERFKIKGGNDLLTTRMAEALDGQIEYGSLLESVTDLGGRFRVALQTESGAREIECDYLILTVPFTILREIELRVELPEVKQRSIRELGYGANSKLIVGYNQPLWRASGFSGGFFTDEAFQTGWDSSRLQIGDGASLTLYSGGNAAVAVGSGSDAQQLAGFKAGLERLFPGSNSALNGKVARFHWPSYPLTRGSYAAYKPGQWTTIAGAEIVPVGNLFFAGEHCSYDFQGFMNGAADTGKTAALALLDAAGLGSERVLRSGSRWRERSSIRNQSITVAP